MGASDVETGDIPQWAVKCFETIWATGFLKLADLHSDHEPAMRDKGFYLGFVKWLANWLNERLAPLRSRKVRALPPAMSEKVQAAMNRVFLVEGYVTGEDLEAFDPLSGKLPEISEECRGETFAKEREFTEGLLLGMRGPSGTPDGSIKCTDATNIYFTICLFWQHVQRMQSSAELHAWLCKLGPPSLIGDKKRIEQLCRRIGLRFRGRGRPRKFYMAAKR
jgi:hypothetical protein